MRDRKRLMALLLCAGLLAVLTVSSAFIVLEAGHACSGKACEICESLAKTEALLRGMACFALLLLIAASLRTAPMAYAAHGASHKPLLSTLVCWKVRLND